VPGPAAPKNPNPTPRPQPLAAPTISNREKAHPYRRYPSPAIASPSQKGEQKADRERLRLETIATRTKQKPESISNREEEAYFFGPSTGGCFSPPAVRPRSTRLDPLRTRDPYPKNSNRESLRLEINVTQTKQTTEHSSNREIEALFHVPPNASPNRRTPPDELEKHKTAPPNFVAIKNHPHSLFCWSYGDS